MRVEHMGISTKRGLGLTKMLTGLAILGVFAAACSDDEPATRDEEGTVTEQGEASAFDVGVGDCLGETSTGVVQSVDLVPCDEPHEAEAYFAGDLPEGEFPGEEAILDYVEANCIPAFEDFVGADYQTSELDFSWLEPTAESWAEGDREVVCVIFEVSGESKTGTARDAQR